uniref:Disease resistance N-terminal domain-containing protein n=1 Tax=Chenopodium quinoa TaxID=63459 RepID=A0A803NB64_CHEQI
MVGSRIAGSITTGAKIAEWFGSELYQLYHKPAVLSHEELLCMAAKIVCDAKVAPYMNKELLRVFTKEKNGMEQLWKKGLVKTSCAEVQNLCSIYESELEKLLKTVKTIKKFLVDADSKCQKLTNEGQNWVENLKDAVYDADDLMDEFNTVKYQSRILWLAFIHVSWPQYIKNTR